MTKPSNRPRFTNTRNHPPPGVVAAAEADYERVNPLLDEFTGKVRELLDSGWTDFEAVTDVYRTMRVKASQEMTLLSAIALVRLAKTPAPPLGESTEQP
jgi:hypothetical protein